MTVVAVYHESIAEGQKGDVHKLYLNIKVHIMPLSAVVYSIYYIESVFFESFVSL